MIIRLNQNHFSPSEISIPDGEPFDRFQSHADGSWRIRPKGRFLIVEDLERQVHGGGERWTVTVPAGTYKMIDGGSMYSHVIIRRVIA
jgi:hypothetical protein